MTDILNREHILKAFQYYGLDIQDVQVISDKEGVSVIRTGYGDKSAVLKCFERQDYAREISNYEILRRCMVPTLTVYGYNEDSILLEDIAESDELRLGCREDLDDPDVIRAIAVWYRTLHSNGRNYVREHGEGMYEEWDQFTLDNIEMIGERLDLKENEGLKSIKDSYHALRKRLDEVERTLTYNDFYYTNLAVRKDRKEALMFDYNLLGKGCYISDTGNVTYWFNPQNRDIFLGEYGPIDEELVIIDRICAPIVTLHSALSRDIFPDWAKEAVNDLDEIPSLLSKLG